MGHVHAAHSSYAVAEFVGICGRGGSLRAGEEKSGIGLQVGATDKMDEEARTSLHFMVRSSGEQFIREEALLVSLRAFFFHDIPVISPQIPCEKEI